MILNLIVIVFLLAMAVMWATYGLFSSLLHLLIVIVSGALAFAFWELFVYKVFMGFAPLYAWGAGLVVPFAAFVIAFRLLTDNLIKGNMQFPPLANQIVGGACGLFSGILTAGVAIIGIGFLPLPPEIAGWQQYEVQSDGQVVEREGGGLWVGVDTMAEKLFNRLSVGSFRPASNTPLAVYVPSVAKQSAVSRLAKFYDPNQSVVATPGTVKASARYHLASADELPGVSAEVGEYLRGKLATAGGGKLVVVASDWDKGDKAATYDTDSVLRLPPTQIRLHVLTDGGTHGEWLAPIGFAKQGDGAAWDFFQINDNRMMASSVRTSDQINWVFALPQSAEPNNLMARLTRVDLPDPTDPTTVDLPTIVGDDLFDPESVAAEGGGDEPTGEGDITTVPEGYATHKIVAVELTNALPRRVSKNSAQEFRYSEAKPNQDSEILSGTGTLGDKSGNRGNSVDRFALSDSLRAVRVKLDRHTPPAGGAAQGNVQAIYLTDARGDQYYPYAYSLMLSDGRQKASINPLSEFKTNTDLPLNEVKPGEELYAYYRVPPGTTITAYHIGDATQELDINVPR